MRLICGDSSGYGSFCRRLQFSSVKPCRLIDTRQTGNPTQGGNSQNFTIT